MWGTNDWEEDWVTVSLQIPRWYPSALAQQTNLGVFPPSGGGVLSLDFLNRTQPNNLYPFLALMPSGGIFIQYFNEARVLDPVTFATTKILPGVPVQSVRLMAGDPITRSDYDAHASICAIHRPRHRLNLWWIDS